MADLIISLLIFVLQQTIITDTIRIGLLVQDKQSFAARKGAELAIDEANRQAKGTRYYTMKVRDMEGPWGTGAKVSVSLVFDEDVWAVIGAVDGRNSHLAEQVSAKTRVPFISALSGDPTLGQAFIPWFFSCVPNDNQAAVLITRAIEKKTDKRTFIISAEDYDSKMAASSLRKTWSAENKPEIIFFKNARDESGPIVKKITGNMVFYGPSSDLQIILQALQKSSRRISVFAPYLMMEEKKTDLKMFEGVVILTPKDLFNNKHPFTSPVEAYSYDAVNITIKGISQSKNDSTSLFKYISKVNHHGVTGQISFDEYGNRKEIPSLVRIEKGRLIPVDD